MNENDQNSPCEEPPEWRAARQAEEQRRKSLLARFRVMLAGGLAIFLGATWLLVRMDGASSLFGWSSAPTTVVRQHLEALNRGDLRAAYDQFSPHYRMRVSFQVYHRLVVTHRRMFRTQEVSLQDRGMAGNRAELETNLLAADGQHYLARFSLVHLNSRWWIDDVHWGQAPDKTEFIRT